MFCYWEAWALYDTFSQLMYITMNKAILSFFFVCLFFRVFCHFILIKTKKISISVRISISIKSFFFFFDFTVWVTNNRCAYVLVSFVFSVQKSSLRNRDKSIYQISVSLISNRLIKVPNPPWYTLSVLKKQTLSSLLLIYLFPAPCTSTSSAAILISFAPAVCHPQLCRAIGWNHCFLCPLIGHPPLRLTEICHSLRASHILWIFIHRDFNQNIFSCKVSLLHSLKISPCDTFNVNTLPQCLMLRRLFTYSSICSNILNGKILRFGDIIQIIHVCQLVVLR